MSKYTTEVRFICEQYAGRSESADYTDIDSVVEAAIPNIFDYDNIPVYVPEHKPLLFKKILLHYYQREIGFETVGLWKLYLNNKMKEIMPYYNQLYASELLEYDPLQNVNNTHEHSGAYEDKSKVDNIRTYDNTTNTENTEITENTRKYDNQTDTSDATSNNRKLGVSESATDTINSSYNRDEDVLLKNKKTTERGNDTDTHTTTTGRDKWTLFSDTPQGGINGVQNGGGTSASGTLSDNAYLTNATHETENDGAYQDTKSHGTITESYNNNNSTPDHTDITGTESSTDTLTRSANENEANSGVAQGQKVDDSLTKDNGTQVGNGSRVDDATTVDDNLKKDNGTDSYTNREYGKIGVETYQEMVIKYRETFLNIDMMIIDELKDLFMKVW